MSASKNYNLRNRGAALQAPPSSPSPEPDRRRYSDVVASRPPSPNRVGEITTTDVGNANLPMLGEFPTETVSRNEKHDFISKEASNDTSDEQDSDSPWHTVSRRRARSLDSAETANKVQKRRGQAPKGKNSGPMTEEKAAKEAATKNQDNDIPQKQGVKNYSRDVESQEEGPSKPKGKGRDPREWGNINLTEQEMDPAIQQAALDSYKQNHPGSKKKRHHYEPEKARERSYQRVVSKIVEVEVTN
jgi:hypothetical protein